MFGMSAQADVVPITGRRTLLEVRQYRSDDAEETLEVFREAVRRGAAKDYSSAQRRAWAPDDIDPAAWAERRASRPTWVVERRGSVVGFSDLLATGEVDMLYVHPDHEGRGVATALLEEVEYAARELSMHRLSAQVSVTALGVFARAGFIVIAPQLVERDGVLLANYRMEKRLRSLA